MRAALGPEGAIANIFRGFRRPEGLVVKSLAAAALVLAVALPAWAQAPDPEAPATTPAKASPAKPKMTARQRFYFGGGVGASFGTVNYVELAPLVGCRITPRVDLGLQPFYRWRDDGQYSTNDYGASLFARFRIIKSLFAEADYQHASYQYVDALGAKARTSQDAFLAGAGYTLPAGKHAGVYFSALYDFTYDENDPYRYYNSPLRLQIGVAVGF